MRVILAAGVVALGLLGCSPTFNWRDVRLEQTPLTALFPCKPDQASRRVALGARDLMMSMWGCDAGGATFAVAYVDSGQTAQVGSLVDQWKAATLGKIQSRTAVESGFVLKGAGQLQSPLRIDARGLRPDGSPVRAHVVWFTSGTLVFQAAMFHAADDDEGGADAFFSGLRFQ